jgi:hypothetical protein
VETEEEMETRSVMMERPTPTQPMLAEETARDHSVVMELWIVEKNVMMVLQMTTSPTLAVPTASSQEEEMALWMIFTERNVMPQS